MAGVTSPGLAPVSSSTRIAAMLRRGESPSVVGGGCAPDAGALARPDRLSSLFLHRGRSSRGEMDDR